MEDAHHTIVGVPDERMAMTVDTILRAARHNIKPVLVLDPPEPEVYLIEAQFRIGFAESLLNRAALQFLRQRQVRVLSKGLS